jgi:hypothetical protein
MALAHAATSFKERSDTAYANAIRISAEAFGTFRQRTKAFVRRADSSKSTGSKV